MNKSERAVENQNQKIREAFETLQKAGFKLENGNPRGDANRVTVSMEDFKSFSHLYYQPLTFDLSAVASEYMLLMMLHQAYQAGHLAGHEVAENENLDNLMCAFPSLEKKMKSIAQDAISEADFDKKYNA